MKTVPETEIARVHSVLSAAEGWKNAELTVQPLTGGNCHKNYLVNNGDRRCVVKLWNNYWESVGVLPAANVVLQNTRVAAEVGVGAPVIMISEEPLGLALDFLVGGHPDLLHDDDAVGNLVPTLHKLHRSGRRFLNDIDPFALARHRLDASRAQGSPIPLGITAVQRMMDRIEKVLSLEASTFVPCHLDLWNANVIKPNDTSSYSIIDWDLAGNCDPCYDVGFVAAMNGFDEEKCHELFIAYFGGEDERQFARTRLFMAVAHWSNSALWISAQGNADPNDGADYEGELAISWEGLLAELTAPNLHQVLAAAAKPPVLV